MQQEAGKGSVARRGGVSLLSKRWQQKLPQLTEQEARPPLPARQEPWHIPLPFPARILGHSHQAVLNPICCSLLRLIPRPSSPPVSSSSSAFQKEQGQEEFTPQRKLSPEPLSRELREKRPGLCLAHTNSMDNGKGLVQTQ